MITDEQVKQLYRLGQRKLAASGPSDEPMNSQFYRGVGPLFWKDQHPGGCARHMTIFKRHNVIPKYCFGCYKVCIEPRTVVELLKLMMVFHSTPFPHDNTRKCIVELRENVPGAYKGFVYCTGLDEGRQIEQFTRAAVSREISDRIPISLKRGCTEYALAWPAYSPPGGDFTMEYPERWQDIETSADKAFEPPPESSIIRTHNQPMYTLADARIMFAWLSYAAMIGDPSYLKISDVALPTTSNVTRPEPFRPVEG